jgi:tRNA threonylcarbamoyladenosine biosynthesis protein TsaE
VPSRQLTLATRAASRRLGVEIARAVRPGDLVILEGGLGAGKTFLARAIVRSAGAKARVNSPTFLLAQEYDTPKGTFVHADMYRLLDRGAGIHAEVARLGLYERRREGAIVLVEWGASALSALGGAPSLVVSLAIVGPTERAATVSGSRADDIV